MTWLKDRTVRLKEILCYWVWQIILCSGQPTSKLWSSKNSLDLWSVEQVYSPATYIVSLNFQNRTGTYRGKWHPGFLSPPPPSRTEVFILPAVKSIASDGSEHVTPQELPFAERSRLTRLSLLQGLPMSKDIVVNKGATKFLPPHFTSSALKGHSGPLGDQLGPLLQLHCSSVFLSAQSYSLSFPHTYCSQEYFHQNPCMQISISESAALVIQLETLVPGSHQSPMTVPESHL